MSPPREWIGWSGFYFYSWDIYSVSKCEPIAEVGQNREQGQFHPGPSLRIIDKHERIVPVQEVIDTQFQIMGHTGRMPGQIVSDIHPNIGRHLIIVGLFPERGQFDGVFSGQDSRIGEIFHAFPMAALQCKGSSQDMCCPFISRQGVFHIGMENMAAVKLSRERETIIQVREAAVRLRKRICRFPVKASSVELIKEFSAIGCSTSDVDLVFPSRLRYTENNRCLGKMDQSVHGLGISA